MSKYSIDNIESLNGHLTRERQGIQYTKLIPLQIFSETPSDSENNIKKLLKMHPKIKSLRNIIEIDVSNDTFLVLDSPNMETHDVSYSIVDLPPEKIAHMDLTCRFPYYSSSGYGYILGGYHFDGSTILAEPIKNRQVQTLTAACKILSGEFATAGIQSNTYVLDNEVSKLL